MATGPEIKTTLTVDDAGATGVLKKLQDSFKQTSEAQKATQAGLGFFQNTLSMAAGSYLPNMIHRVKEFGESFIEAARNESKQITATAAMISSLEAVPWAKAKADATELSERLDGMALSMGSNLDDTKQAFQIMLETGGVGAENLEKSIHATEQLTAISGVLGMSVATITREYQMLGDGLVGPRSQLFQLLQSTGIFGEKTKGASAAWAKLSDEDRQARLAKGMEQLGGTMSKIPLGMGKTLQQMSTMADMMKEQLGLPLLQAITPQLKKLVEWMKAGRGSIEEFAKAMVVDVSKYAEEAARVIRAGWAYIRENSREIKEDIMAAWGFAKSVIQFAIEHKELLLAGYAAKAAIGSDVGKAAWGAGKAIYTAGAAGVAGTVAASAAGAAGTSAAGAAGVAGTAAASAGVWGGVAALGAFTLAIGAVALAAHQGVKLMGELEQAETADARARLAFFEDMSNKETAGYEDMTQQELTQFALMKEKLLHEASAIGLSDEEVGRITDSALATRNANRAMVVYAEEAAKALATGVAAKSGGRPMEFEEQTDLVGKIAGQFQEANNVMDSGAQTYIATLLGKSAVLQKAFLESADMTSGGFTALADLTKGSAVEFSEALRGLAESASKKEKTTAHPPMAQFNGGQTFKIQQDFRDQDPDRIAVVFQRDVIAAAERRYQSASASPFGA